MVVDAHPARDRSPAVRPFVVRARYPSGAAMRPRRYADRGTSEHVAECLRRAGCSVAVVYVPTLSGEPAVATFRPPVRSPSTRREPSIWLVDAVDQRFGAVAGNGREVLRCRIS